MFDRDADLTVAPRRAWDSKVRGSAMANPFEIRGLDHVVIRVNDIGVMKRFYCDVLGCVLERAETSLGLYQLRAGACLIDLVDIDGSIGRGGGGPPDPEHRNMDHFCLRIDPFKEAVLRTHLNRHGVEPGKVVDRYGADGRGSSMYISDPEGNMIELKGPAREGIRQSAPR